MRRNIAVEVTDAEGLLYDPDEARTSGLMESLEVFVVHPETGDSAPLTLNDRLMEELIRALDLGVNVPPGEHQTLVLTLNYVYDYEEA